MDKTMKLALSAIAAIFLSLLFGCGGGGGAPSTQTPDNPNPPTDESPVQSEYDTPEFRQGYAKEQMGALYAYENGYHGQGVKIAVQETGARETHQDLAPNIFAATGYQGELRIPTHNPDRFQANHGTLVAGMIAGARNGLGMHGIAPQAKMAFYFNSLSDYSENNRWLRENGFSVGSNTTGYGGRISSFDDNSVDEIINSPLITEDADKVMTVFAGLDFVDVISANNGGRNGITEPLIRPGADTAYYPLIHPEIEPHILIVPAVMADNTIAPFSDACGEATKMWCVSSYGRFIYTTDDDADDDYATVSGTSFSAPLVAGALAVLKSAMPQMKMTDIRLVLLSTATPLYADGEGTNGERMMSGGNPVLSEVYGWGLVNISAGITHLQGIRGQLSAIEQMANVRLGGAAKAASGNQFAPAVGEESFRFWGGIENENRWTGIATKEYGGVSGFAEYGNSDLRINSFLSHGEIRNAESENWTAGFRYADIWRHNDNLQIFVREESPVNSGDLVLHYSFGKQIIIPVRQKPTTIWTAAYSQRIPAFAGTSGGEWTAAAEWNEQTNAKGFSAEWRVEF